MISMHETYYWCHVATVVVLASLQCIDLTHSEVSIQPSSTHNRAEGLYKIEQKLG